MSSRAKYKTRQRTIVLDYLKSVPGVHVTAADVCRYMKAQGYAIGQSTVYRQLESLVDDGTINKYIIDGNTPACFEYVEDESHKNAKVCFHCKCEKCGKLIHMHCDELESISAHLYDHHHFRLDPLRTVFYGICEECLQSIG